MPGVPTVETARRGGKFSFGILHYPSCTNVGNIKHTETGPLDNEQNYFGQRVDAGKEKAPFRASFHREGRPKLYPFLGGTGVPAVCYRPASDDNIFMAYEGADILSCFSRSGNI